jgi:hypothetical protein
MKEVTYNPIVDQDAVATVIVVNDNILTEADTHGIWHDPFYENDDSVIAAFAFDHESLDRSLIYGWINIVIFSLLFLGSLRIHWVLALILGVLDFVVVMEVCKMLTRQYWHRRTHIALATSGIYVDDVREPNSRVLMRRLVFKYEDYKHCYVEQSDLLSCGNMEYQILLKNQADVPIFLVTGLMGTQLFADKVNARIKQVSALQTEAVQPAVPSL